MTGHHRAPIQVMLLDDHPVVREGVAGHLEKEADIALIGSYSTSRDLIAALAVSTADVLLVDYSLGPHDTDGVNLIRTLRIRSPDSAILVVSGHCKPALVSLALRAGAHGFVGKSQPQEEMAEAIRVVASGRRYIGPSMEAELDIDLDAPAPAVGEAGGDLLTSHARLTPREREVLRCFLDGMSISEIAGKFSRDVNTISTQKQAALRKLGIRTNNELFKIRQYLADT